MKRKDESASILRGLTAWRTSNTRRAGTLRPNETCTWRVNEKLKEGMVGDAHEAG